MSSGANFTLSLEGWGFEAGGEGLVAGSGLEELLHFPLGLIRVRDRGDIGIMQKKLETSMMGLSRVFISWLARLFSEALQIQLSTACSMQKTFQSSP